MQLHRVPALHRDGDAARGSRFRSIPLVAAGCVAGLLAGLPAHATVTNTWTATGSANWSDSGNWATAAVPMNAGDVAELPASSSRTNIITTAITVGTIKAGGAAAFRVILAGGSLTFDSGGSDKAWLQQLAGTGRCNIAPFTLNSDLDLVVSNTQYFDINGVSGSRDVHINRTTGTGTPYVGGVNTSFTGNWHIYAGTLMFTGDPFGSTASGTRAITIYNNASLRNNGNPILNASRRIVIDSSGGTIQPNTRSMTLDAAGQLAGNGKLTYSDQNSGAFVLNAANDGFTGSIIVGGAASITNRFVLGANGSISNAVLIHLTAANGWLDVAGKASGYNIPAGQVVAGVGSVRGKLNVATAGAQVHPGTYTLPGPALTPGTLTVTNGLAMANGGAYLWTLKALKDNVNGVAGTDFGKLAVTAGPVSLAGGVLTLAFTGAAAGTGHPDNGNIFWKGEHAWTILTADSPPSGVLTVSNGSYTVGEFKTQVSGNSLLLVYGRPIRATVVIVR